MTTYLVNLEEENVDLNTLFSFDLLKKTIEFLINNQKVTNQKILDLEAKLQSNNQKRSFNQNTSIEKKEKTIKKVIEVIEKKEEIIKVENKDLEERRLIEKEIEKQIQQTININLEDSNQLNNKIASLDIQLKQIKFIKQDIIDLNEREEETREMLKLQEEEINESKFLLKSVRTTLGKFERDIENLKIKAEDFNIFDLMKGKSDNSGGSNSGGNSDQIVALVQNIERKTFKKFDLVDDKIKSFQDEIYKKKNEITNLMTMLENMTKIISNNKENTTKEITEKFDNINELINKRDYDLKNNFHEELKNVSDLLENKFKDISGNFISHPFDKKEDEIEKEIEISKPGFSDSDMKLLKDLTKKVQDLDRAFRIFYNTLNPDLIKQEINKIAENANQKLSLHDFNEFKENFSQISNTVLFLKETISQLSEDKKILDDFNWLKKRVENLSSSFVNIKPDDINSSSTKHVHMDVSRFVDAQTYNDFVKNYNKEIDRVNWRLDELKLMVDDIITSLTNKVTDKDLKTLEEYLIARIEEIKLNSHKKYADKNETNKNIKYLDSQIKHITDVYIKKMEKGDNWLLASKPMGGYKCASCENYLGDLNENNHHLPWNKIPLRDPSERLYRVGNGFSRMLQMLNIDNTSKGDEVEMTATNYKKDGQRPRVTEKHFHQSLYNINSESINVSADNIKMDGDANYHEENNVNQPKIVKIYKKKNKEVKNEIKSDNKLDSKVDISKTKETKSDNAFTIIKSLK